MSFRRVSIIGTLMAAAMALLIILPVWAGDGEDVVQKPGTKLTVEVGSMESGGKFAQKPTRLGETIYVSNDDESTSAYRVVQVELETDVATNQNLTDQTASKAAALFSISSGTGDPLVVDSITGTGKAGAPYTFTFEVETPSSAGAPDPGNLGALHGDTIKITAGGLTSRLVVDGESPVFSSISPANKRLQSSSSVTVGFVVTDDDSGLRTDREDATDGDGGADGDNRTAEPLSADQYGTATDIDVFWDSDTGGNEGIGDRRWTEIVRDHSYSVSYENAGLTSKDYKWYIQAKDRVGNSSRTDSKSRDFTLTVDRDGPVADSFYAGIGFDVDDGEEVKDASSVLVIFSNEERGLDPATVAAADFSVGGNTVTGVIHPNKGEDVNEGAIEEGDTKTAAVLCTQPDVDANTGTCKNGTAGVTEKTEAIPYTDAEAAKDDTCDSHTGYQANDGRTAASVCINTRNRVYLTLGAPLDDDDTPEVQILGGSINDLAGNGNDRLTGSDAKDRIAPSLDVVVTGDVETDGRPLGQEEITVDIASGERLSSDPDVWLAAFDENGKIVGTPAPQTADDDGANRWTVTIDGNDDTKVAALIIRAQDRSDNPGNVSTTTGYSSSATPADGGTLNLTKLAAAGLLVEFDSDIDPATFELNPSNDNSETTESSSPFIELTFTEGSENTMGGEDDFTDSKDVKTKFDAYGTVTIDSVTLDGDDVSNLLDRLGSGAFSVSLSGLAIGEHTLAYTASDTAGNTVDKEHDFEVVARSAYKVNLRPGWNLVSFPASPIDTSIDSVLPAGHPATDVLQYAGGIWTSASRGPDGAWEGDLTDIDGEHAYWINTISTDPLEAVLAEPGTGAASRPPSLQLIAGWNLVPVADIDQDDEGTKQGNYWSSLDDADFVIAYTYDATTRKWARHTFNDMGDGGPVENGQGVWVYSRSNTTLIP